MRPLGSVSLPSHGDFRTSPTSRPTQHQVMFLIFGLSVFQWRVMLDLSLASVHAKKVHLFPQKVPSFSSSGVSTTSELAQFCCSQTVKSNILISETLDVQNFPGGPCPPFKNPGSAPETPPPLWKSWLLAWCRRPKYYVNSMYTRKAENWFHHHHFTALIWPWLLLRR